MIALSGWLVYEKKGAPGRRTALIWYGAQLFLNLIWSFLFFYFRNPFLGVVDIFALAIAIGGYILASWKVSKPASILFVPYFLWVLYAASLNAFLV